jgi:diketogulonate reductase-like aldo/keto reductase
MDLTSTAKLNNGVEIPWVGFGVFQVEPGKEVEQAVTWALETGYRHIDTASFYRNEDGVGKAIKESGVSRRDLFVTTKVWNDEQGYDKTLEAFEQSLNRLQVDYVDLYLVHWPIKGMYKDTWRAFEKLYDDGKVRAIGVSNFFTHHLEDLMADARVVPMVNQVEFHPFLLQKELLDFDRDHGIQHEAWSPLTRARFLDNEVIQDLAAKHTRTPAQILLRWDLQHGVVTLPRSTSRERIRENSEVFGFELSAEDMARLDGLDTATRIGPHPDQMS